MKLNRSWLMVLCVVGMGALFILPAVGIGIGSLFAFLLILLCPLSHLLMMRGLGGGGGRCHGSGNEQAPGQSKAQLPAEAQAPAAVEGGKSSKA